MKRKRSSCIQLLLIGAAGLLTAGCDVHLQQLRAEICCLHISTPTSFDVSM